jgi:tetratricopeptide (TPR) repeat protein
MRLLRPLVLATLVGLAPAAAVRAQEGERVGFTANVAPDTIYVGQQATYALTVRIPADIRQRLRRNPEFVPPEPRAMLAYELPISRSASPADAVEVHTFRRALFVLTPGRYQIPAARLSYALPQSASFFSREDERVLRSATTSFIAIDPPTRGRPADWLGAVGVWRASARVDRNDPRVGDPVVLTLRLEGEGNPTLLPRPVVTIPWADAVPQGEAVVLEAAPLMLGGVKEFSWLITPREEGNQSVPPIAYSFFDPDGRAYAVARTGPVSLRVRPGTLVAVPPRAAALRDAEVIPLRPALAGPARTTLPGVVWWMWIALLAPLPWLALRFIPRRERQMEQPTGPRSARALLERGLRARTGVDVAAHTTPGALAAALRLEGVTPETALAAEQLRDACDAQAFARGDRRDTTQAARERAESLLARVEREARRYVAPVLVLAVLLVAGCVDVSRDDTATLMAFSEGHTAYAGRDYSVARDAFIRAANAAPRDAAVWSNLGTAAWAANDTAMAVLGWQKALRLDPRDDAVRQLLARVRAPQHRGAARVWPVEPWLVAGLAMLWWLAGWGWAFMATRRGARARFAAVLLVPGVMCAALAGFLEYTTSGRDLAVVMQPTPLRALPALGADPGAVPLAGEVAKVRERRGVWLRIELDGEREGWIPAERTRSLARD